MPPSIIPFLTLSSDKRPNVQRRLPNHSEQKHCGCGRRISGNKESCAACIIATKAPENLVAYMEAHPEAFVQR